MAKPLRVPVENPWPCASLRFFGIAYLSGQPSTREKLLQRLALFSVYLEEYALKSPTFGTSRTACRLNSTLPRRIGGLCCLSRHRQAEMAPARRSYPRVRVRFRCLDQFFGSPFFGQQTCGVVGFPERRMLHVTRAVHLFICYPPDQSTKETSFG